MIRKLAILLATLTVGFGAVVFIPYDNELQPASLVSDQLPEKLRGWTGVELEPTEKERAWLAEDTEFRKRSYHLFEPETVLESWESVHVSMVLSGNDLNGSIHRPERCLVSQGHTNLQVSTVPLPLGDGRTLKVNRVFSKRPIAVKGDSGEEEEKPIMDCVTYYWFVGHGRITEDHLERTLMDMKDRLMGGYVQQWAYFSISSDVTASVADIGRSVERTDEVLQDFVRAVYRSCVAEDQLVAGR